MSRLRHHTARVLVLGVLILGAAGGCRTPDEAALAEVEGEPITSTRYLREYIDYLSSSGLPDEPSRRRAFLERMISVRLVTLEGREEGLDRTPEFEHYRETARRRLLVDAWLAQTLFDTLSVSQADLEEMFARVNTRVTARHLFAGSLEEARRLETRLAEGERFEDLAREVFADSTLAGNGGSVGTFGFDEMDPAFEEVAFSIPVGSTSQPVRTTQGWSIIRVDDRFTNPILTASEFAGRLPQLETYVRERRRGEIRRRLAEELEAGLSVELEAVTAERLLDQITGTVASESLVADDETLVRFTTPGGERHWTIADFREAARYTSDRQRESVKDARTLQAFVTGLVVRQEMLDRAAEVAVDGTVRFREALDTALGDWLYERSYDRLSRSVPVHEDTLKAYFDAHTGEFTIPERIGISEIVTTSKQRADSILALTHVEAFDVIARRHSVRKATASVGGHVGPMSRSELGPWAEQAFSAREGDVIGPFELRGQYLLLLVGARSPSRAATFDEVRTDIETMLKRERQRDFFREHAQSLRKRFQVSYSGLKPEDLPLQSPPIRPS